MKRIAVCGHFGIGLSLLNGQTVKTVIVTDELEKELGENSVWRIDTHGRWNHMLMFLKLIWAQIFCDSIVILPAHGALLYEVPWLYFWNKLFNKKLFYIVIGGWLNDYLKTYPKIAKELKSFNGIFVETSSMKRDLEEVGFQNIIIMPNCKPLKVLSENELTYCSAEPLPLVTFSRVMEEKGIGELVRIVKEINHELGRVALSLDIYGQVDNNQIDWFETLKKSFDSTIQYKGCVAFDKSTDVLSQYFALLFPTKFYTEGVPGTIIDAYSAGLPVISSRWANVDDVVDDGSTGLGFDFENWNELKTILKKIIDEPSIIYRMKKFCLIKAIDYLPEHIVPKLVQTL